MSIAQNITYIKNRIEDACKRAGRNVEDIILVGVSKTQSFEKILEAKESGLNVFGESKAQELALKYEKVKDVRWHFIGHLQKNKVKYIIDKVDLIHSLDDIELAQEIDKRAKKINRIMDVLIQINIGKEDTKFGIFEEDIYNFINSVNVFENINIKGLMCIPPANASEYETRIYFKKMKQIFDDIKNKYNNLDFKYLSMGMTDDFEIAIEEGANIIRVGTGIFGERIYKKEENI